MSCVDASGHFIEGAKGPIFVLWRKPPVVTLGCVLVVPPFAEEMNKSRRMVTEVALGLARQGVATLVPDLYGTGDSAGDFADGDWATWLADLSAATRWCAAQRCPVTGILAIRLGCALAAAATATSAVSPVQRTVLWQPVFDGGRFLSQFLRLRVAASLMEDRRETLAELRSLLKQKAALEVAGYSLTSQLAADLEDVGPPEFLPKSLGEVSWLEVVREAGAQLSQPSTTLIEDSRRHGVSVHAVGVVGEPYWSSTEIVVNHDIVAATVAVLGGVLDHAEGA